LGALICQSIALFARKFAGNLHLYQFVLERAVTSCNSVTCSCPMMMDNNTILNRGVSNHMAARATLKIMRFDLKGSNIRVSLLIIGLQFGAVQLLSVLSAVKFLLPVFKNFDEF
jgi:hypothetical protein